MLPSPTSLMLLATAFAGYLIGAWPSGRLVGAFGGADPRDYGSGNVGATNVVRVLGWRAGLTVALLDVAKGGLAVSLALALGPRVAPTAEALAWVGPVAGFAAILGHVAPPLGRRHGGKGIATAAGAALGLVPWAALASMAIFALVVGLSRRVSVGSLAAVVTLPLAVLLLSGGGPRLVFALGLLPLAGWTHRANLRRLRAGEEPRISSRSARTASPWPRSDAPGPPPRA